MKLFSDCSGECAVCGCAGLCRAGNGDDDSNHTSAKRIIETLQKGQYSSYKELMIETLKTQYNINYEELAL